MSESSTWSGVYKADDQSFGATLGYVLPKYVARFGWSWSSASACTYRRPITQDTELHLEDQSLLEDELDWNFYVEGLKPREVKMLRARFLPAGRYNPQFFDDLFE
jgi:hypothetical protein